MDTEIIKKYPMLFGEPPFNPKESLMCFGFECSEYWYDDIEKMLRELKLVVAYNNLIDFKILQVKEKFGELRIYTNNNSQDVIDLINKCSKKVSTVCQTCGKEGKLKNIDGWLRVICPECEGRLSEKKI